MLNIEMIMFFDMDLEKLKLVWNEGFVINLKDWCVDMYDLKKK